MTDPRWAPFDLAEPGAHGDAPRSIHTPDGVGDRLRSAAFAEIQAREAFYWAVERFSEERPELREAWRRLAASEQRHLDWLLKRMEELNVPIRGRKVSDFLWLSFMGCKTSEEFARYMASAEERGRRAGERFYKTLLPSDPRTAEIFKKIAEEEIAHIELASRYFPEKPLEAAPV